MATKCTGAEFKRFYRDPIYWVEEKADPTWHDDGIIEVNGEEVESIDTNAMKDADIVKIHGGIVFGPTVGASEPSLEGYFRRWKRAQTTVTIVVEADAAKMDAIKDAVKKAGGKVL